MSQRAIEVDAISKRYVIGGVRESQYTTIRDSLTGLFRRSEIVEAETIDALRDVSFNVDEGEVVGLIGRNGAGKSTLLKVLSRITEPTSGSVRLWGRVGSLLEVGTGFHPELTGRENIFLNGAILGMRRREISARLDQIVEFAEIERFLDTPVKRYSSGMYVRLAFAVAAHLEVDILIVDEVLAVGDARFQRKCLDKMKDVGRLGRSVIFVSHNLASVTRLCPRALLLERGSVVADGPSHDVVRKYLRADIGTTARREWGDESAPSNQYVRLTSIDVRADGNVADRIDIRSASTISVEWDALREDRILIPTLHVTNENGVVVFVTQDLDPVWRNRRRERGHYVSRVTIPGNFLSEGTFVISLSINTPNTGETHVSEQDVVAFDIVDPASGDTARGDYGGEMPGVVRPLLPWSNEFSTRPGAAE